MAVNGQVQLSRRRFVRKAGVLGGAAWGTPYYVASSALAGPGRVGANDRVRIGVVGTGFRGRYLIANVPSPGRVVALCDCARSRMEETVRPRGIFAQPLARFREMDAGRCVLHQDYRRLFDQEKLDAVVIATCDHHHVQAAVLACQAGLDIYLEKPMTLTVAEGRTLVRAVNRYGRVLQVGSQQRTMEYNRFACEWVRDGGLGKVTLVEMPNYPGPMRPGSLPTQVVPAGLDWNLFCGPTPLRTYNRKYWVKDLFEVDGLLWRGWDLWRSYSGHLMTNWGAHSVDMVQYALGADNTGPVEIWPETGALAPSLYNPWRDKTPPPPANGQGHGHLMRFCPVSMRYRSGTEMRFCLNGKQAVLHGTRGRLYMSRNSFRTVPAGLAEDPPPASVKEKWKGAGYVARPHIQNWLDCIATRAQPHATVEIGHRSATVCHLANLARELGRRLRWDPRQEQFLNDAEANSLLDRPRRSGFQLPSVG